MTTPEALAAPPMPRRGAPGPTRGLPRPPSRGPRASFDAPFDFGVLALWDEGLTRLEEAA